MTIEIKVPSPGESITEVQLSNWLVEDGTWVEKDQDIAEVDSDKATLSIAAEASGIIKFKVQQGATIEVGSVVATIEAGEQQQATAKPAKPASDANNLKSVPEEPKLAEVKQPEKTAGTSEKLLNLSPLARKLMEHEGLNETELIDFFKHYRLGKKDIAFYLDNKSGLTAQPETKKNRACSNLHR